MQKVVNRRYFFPDEITGALTDFVSKGYNIVSVTSLGPNQMGGQDYLIIYEESKGNMPARDSIIQKINNEIEVWDNVKNDANLSVKKSLSDSLVKGTISGLAETFSNFLRSLKQEMEALNAKEKSTFEFIQA